MQACLHKVKFPFNYTA